MIVITLYLWLCLAIAVGFLTWFAFYDILCLLKLAQPDSKFGYYYGSAFPLTIMIVVMASMPLINLYTVFTFIQLSIVSRKK